MRTDVREEFFIAPGLTYLNHASYGAVTRGVAAAAQHLAGEIEADPVSELGAAALAPRFRAISDGVAQVLGLPPDRTVLTPNATSGAAALTASLPMTAKDVVVVLDTEYASTARGWEVRCEQFGARFIRVPITLPFTGPDQLIADLDVAVSGGVTYLLVSQISSSTAVVFPIDTVARWVEARGGRVLVDAAHSPGHVPVPVPEGPIAAVFGNLHKWYPTMRAVGLLSLAPDLVGIVRPAEVSLTWDAADLTQRFSWPGTFDPTSRLSVPAAIAQMTDWCATGRLAAAERLASKGTALLTELGLTATTLPEFMPPRLRSFFIDSATVSEVQVALADASLRAWVGRDANERTILRISTHVYNDVSDLTLLASVVRKLSAR